MSIRKRLLCLAAALALVLCACSHAPGEDGTRLYFPQASYLKGAALGSESAGLEGDSLTVDALITALLAGPADSSLTSPFPAGVSLRSWYEEEGVLHINLSEQYGGLSGFSLTLADYSIALTLCQLEGVEGVSITVENDPMPFRYRQTLTPADVLLSDLLGSAQP